jgi:Polysaccharide lyase
VSAARGGLPRLAIVSLLALLLALSGAALISLRPWEDTPLVPGLTVSPGLGIGLGDATVVAPARHLRVAEARVAGVGHPAFVGESRVGPEPSSRPEVGISAARPLVHLEPTPVATRPPQPPPASSPVVPVVMSEPSTPPPPAPAPEPQLVANFESGLRGWSIAAAGDVVPVVVTGLARDGSKSSLVLLTGEQSRSQLILGGDGGDDESETVQIREGDEYGFAVSFFIQAMAYGEPGADNVIVRLKSDESETDNFGLQLWEQAGDLRGLWSSGDAMGGDRFLAPTPEGAWHDLVVRFRASSHGDGFYEIYLDGQLIDVRSGVSLIAPGSSQAQIEVGLLRDPDWAQGTSAILFDAAKLGTPESILP